MIVRGHFTSIESSRKEEAKPQNLNVNVNIDAVRENADLLEFTYTYTVNYKPDVGIIKISGKALYKGEEHGKIVESWSKDKKIPPEVGKEVVNSIMWNCSIQATNLAASMGLHPPVMVPSVGNKPVGEKMKSDDLRYFG